MLSCATQFVICNNGKTVVPGGGMYREPVTEEDQSLILLLTQTIDLQQCIKYPHHKAHGWFST